MIHAALNVKKFRTADILGCPDAVYFILIIWRTVHARRWAIGFQPGETKSDTTTIGRYVSMNSGKVNAYSTFLKLEQCIWRHSLTVVIAPSAKSVR